MSSIEKKGVGSDLPRGGEDCMRFGRRDWRLGGFVQ